MPIYIKNMYEIELFCLHLYYIGSNKVITHILLRVFFKILHNHVMIPN
jgi:hypothetical protein